MFSKFLLKKIKKRSPIVKKQIPVTESVPFVVNVFFVFPRVRNTNRPDTSSLQALCAALFLPKRHDRQQYAAENIPENGDQHVSHDLPRNLSVKIEI